MTTVPSVLTDRAPSSRPRLPVAHIGATNLLLTPVLSVAAVVVAVIGAVLPWVTVLHGFQPVAGINLGGGDLAGLVVVGVVALLAAHRHGLRAGRPVAALAGAVVVVGAVAAARNLAAYVADPGPATPPRGSLRPGRGVAPVPGS
jgi:hypothetical protein